jgi:hypothetical protein
MSAGQFSEMAAAANQAELVAGGNRTTIWYPGSVQVTGFGGDATTDTLWIEGKAVRGRRVALAAAIELPPNLPIIRRTMERSASVVGLDMEVHLQRNRRARQRASVVARCAHTRVA